MAPRHGRRQPEPGRVKPLARGERLRLLESVVGNANDAVVLTDFAPEGEPRIVFVNAAFTEQTGYEASEVVGRHPRMLVGPESDREAQLRLRRAAEHHEPVTVELSHYRKDGTQFVVENSVRPVVDDAGRCTHLVSIQRDVTERKLAEAALAHQRRHDSLTGLPNRVEFSDRLQRALAVGPGASVAVLLIDLDRFKLINDTLGHHVGDQVLREVAARLTTAVPAPATVARLGGDEFALVVPNVTRAEAAELVAARILVALQDAADVDGTTVPMDASVGVALAPLHGTDGSDLFRRAELAMYRAKEHGTGYAVYADESDDRRLSRLGLVVELRQAIAAGQLELHYQPVVDLASRRVAAVEALVRWRHPERGLLPPDEFVPMAEETGLIRPLTDWVLATALAQVAHWHARGWPVRVSVNLSARMAADTELPEQVLGALRRAGVAPGALELEITESAVMADPEGALAVFTRLDEMGVHLTLDDFGTGYSSLGYLKHFPARGIKVDRSFVLDMLTDERDASIVRAVIELGHTLGLTVVAEGVEDSAVLDALARLGCDQAQGFHLGRPVPPGALTPALGRNRAS